HRVGGGERGLHEPLVAGRRVDDHEPAVAAHRPGERPLGGRLDDLDPVDGPLLEPLGRGGLAVGVHEDDRVVAPLDGGRGQVDGGRRLPDTPLEVGDDDVHGGCSLRRRARPASRSASGPARCCGAARVTRGCYAATGFSAAGAAGGVGTAGGVSPAVLKLCRRATTAARAFRTPARISRLAARICRFASRTTGRISRGLTPAASAAAMSDWSFARSLRHTDRSECQSPVSLSASALIFALAVARSEPTRLSASLWSVWASASTVSCLAWTSVLSCAMSALIAASGSSASAAAGASAASARTVAARRRSFFI